jgi:hypothetical protein
LAEIDGHRPSPTWSSNIDRLAAMTNRSQARRSALKVLRVSVRDAAGDGLTREYLAVP